MLEEDVNVTASQETERTISLQHKTENSSLGFTLAGESGFKLAPWINIGQIDGVKRTDAREDLRSHCGA